MFKSLLARTLRRRPSKRVSLPSELLIEILLHSVADRRFQSQPFCFVLCLVCREWNSLVLNASVLWSFVRVMHGPKNSSVLGDKLDRWMKLSGNCLLDIRIGSDFDDSQIDAVFTSLVAHSKRWKIVDFQIDIHSGYYRHSTALRVWRRDEIDMTNLRSACLRYFDEPPKCFEDAPLLRHLKIHLPYYGNPGLLLSGGSGIMQYSQLRTLSILAGSPALPQDIVRCLSLNVALTSLTVFTVESVTALPLGSVSAPQLLHLKLVGSSHLLHALECPALRELRLSGSSRAAESSPLEELMELLPFLERTPSLQTLKVTGAVDLGWLADPRLSNCLIKTLVLCFPAPLNGCIFPPLGDSVLLEQLSSISLSFPWWDLHRSAWPSRLIETLVCHLPIDRIGDYSGPSVFPSLEMLCIWTDRYFVIPTPEQQRDIVWCRKDWVSVQKMRHFKRSGKVGMIGGRTEGISADGQALGQNSVQLRTR
ncbi:hypothetical protein DL96DRAFT_872008 [Flagelloscypha sp. PMI_526]|nr:hypothetical protein DL96DRAFT_872008 [Flagelloscypha sp. PMI_526]